MGSEIDPKMPDPKMVHAIACTAGRMIVESVARDHIVHKAMAQHGIGHDNVYAWSETYDRVLGELAVVLKPLTQSAEQPQDDGNVRAVALGAEITITERITSLLYDLDARTKERDEARELACVSLDILKNVSDEPMRELYDVDDFGEMPDWFTGYGKPSGAPEARDAKAGE